VAAHTVRGVEFIDAAGSAWNYSTRRDGIQSLEGPASLDAAPTDAGTRLGGTKFVT